MGRRACPTLADANNDDWLIAAPSTSPVDRRDAAHLPQTSLAAIASPRRMYASELFDSFLASLTEIDDPQPDDRVLASTTDPDIPF